MRILHVLPGKVLASDNYYLGSVKDIKGRTEFFKKNNILYDEVVIKDNLVDIVNFAKEVDLSMYNVVFFETQKSIIAIKILKKRYVNVVFVIRSINAEFIHRIHHAVARLKIERTFAWRQIKFDFKKIFFGLMYDFYAVKYADFVFSISEWEKDNYWRWFPWSDKVIDSPYFLPKEYEVGGCTDIKSKKCISFMTSTKNVNHMLLDSLHNLDKQISKNFDKLEEWTFPVTGNVDFELIECNPKLKPTGFLESPFELLNESKAIVILSDFGFGFKTKILDAINCNCRIIVTRKLYQRLPVEVKASCIVLDLDDRKSFVKVLDDCNADMPKSKANDLLREKAFSSISKVLSILQ